MEKTVKTKPTKVVMLDEVRDQPTSTGRVLCLQRCRYMQPEGPREGFRFMWRDENGGLIAQRGQARIPSLAVARKLMAMAEQAGWGDYVSEESNDWLFIRHQRKSPDRSRS